jgi:hypothetical protein
MVLSLVLWTIEAIRKHTGTQQRQIASPFAGLIGFERLTWAQMHFLWVDINVSPAFSAGIIDTHLILSRLSILSKPAFSGIAL